MSPARIAGRLRHGSGSWMRLHNCVHPLLMLSFALARKEPALHNKPRQCSSADGQGCRHEEQLKRSEAPRQEMDQQLLHWEGVQVSAVREISPPAEIQWQERRAEREVEQQIRTKCRINDVRQIREWGCQTN